MLSGFFKEYPIENFVGDERTIILDPATNPVAPRAGLSYYLDLRDLDLGDRADNSNSCLSMRVRFFENGIPLENELCHCRIEQQPGLYSHWDHYIAFSPLQSGTPGYRAIYSIRYLELNASHRWLGTIASPRLWACAAAICLVGLILIGSCCPRWLWLGLIVGIAPHVVSTWDQVITTADSASYVKNSGRPPLYPWFIQACKGEDELCEAEFQTVDRPLPSPSSPLLRVIRLQRLFFWTSFLFAAACMSLVAPRPLTVLMFFSLYLGGMLSPDLENTVMSETLASAFLFLVMACFFIALARRSLYALPLLALAFSGLVLTRSAGVFGVVFLAVSVVAAVITNWHRKAALATALSAVGFIGMAALGAVLWNSHVHNGVWALSPLRNWERVAFALQCADETDCDAMPDQDARHFLGEAIRRQREQFIREHRRDPSVEDFDLNLNCWIVASPVASEMFRAKFGDSATPECPVAPFAYTDALFARVANIVLARHRDRYYRIVKHSFFTLASRDYTRIKLRYLPLLALVGLALLGCLVGRNMAALAGATCMAAHLASLVIVSSFELPLPRYVHFSEWLCLLGLLLSGLSCCQYVIARLWHGGSSEPKNDAAERSCSQTPIRACA
jgi:hypothetical protein